MPGIEAESQISLMKPRLAEEGLNSDGVLLEVGRVGRELKTRDAILSGSKRGKMINSEKV